MFPGQQLSINNGDAHGAASAGNLGFSSFQSVAVQIGHLGLGNLGDLCLGDGANLVLVGHTGTALQTDGLQNQQGGRHTQ